MGLGDLFKLTKLTIEGHKDAKRADASPAKFTAQYNPESFSLRHASVFQGPAAPGQTSSGEWSYSQPKQLSITLILDGTGVGELGAARFSRRRTVADQIHDFLAVCYQVEGTSHEPLYLKLRWGKALEGFAAIGNKSEPSFDCRLQSVDVAYKSFDRDGAPLHAELAAVFVASLEPSKDAKEKSPSSPDLTHRRLVVAGDTLPLLCREIYGSAEHYLRIAQVNQLDDFRDLTPGTELVFPPFARRDRA